LARYKPNGGADNRERRRTDMIGKPQKPWPLGQRAFTLPLVRRLSIVPSCSVRILFGFFSFPPHT
jgi:hypothetical protein